MTFADLLSKAKAKGYRPFGDNEHHQTVHGRNVECIFLYVWLRVKTKTDLPIVFIEGIEPDKQVEILIEEIGKL